MFFFFFFVLAPRSGQGEITNGTFRFPLPSSAGFPVLPIFFSVQHILFVFHFFLSDRLESFSEAITAIYD
jgi:hypothetical protein